MLLIRQNYKFESYLQPKGKEAPKNVGCCWYVKITNLKAIYNCRESVLESTKMLLIRQNYKFESYLQLETHLQFWNPWCCWYVKITNLKAIYNKVTYLILPTKDVVDTSKLQIWKLFTTLHFQMVYQQKMLLIRQNYKFESYLQRNEQERAAMLGCCWYVKITNLKAIYNSIPSFPSVVTDVVDTSKLQIWKLFTTHGICWQILHQMLLIRQNYKFESYLQPDISLENHYIRCCWYVKITNLKAIYNNSVSDKVANIDVVDTSKLQIWKLFTTACARPSAVLRMLLIRQNYKFESYLQQERGIVSRWRGCCWYVKITNLKAIYNTRYMLTNTTSDVVDTSKLQIWKLFTTMKLICLSGRRCCWYVKITNLKAIYNYQEKDSCNARDVVDTSKLQIWKLFTTHLNLLQSDRKMLLIRQNYKFESYLQLLSASESLNIRCCWYVKITNLKAIYNNLHGTILQGGDVVDTSKLQIWKLFTT